MEGRLQLVKSVVKIMLLHSLQVYYCLVKLFKNVEIWIISFIWSGDIEKRKLTIVSWYKCNWTTIDGGLGPRSLVILNKILSLNKVFIHFSFRKYLLLKYVLEVIFLMRRLVLKQELGYDATCWTYDSTYKRWWIMGFRKNWVWKIFRIIFRV